MVEVIYLKEMKMKNRKWKSFRIEEIFIVVDGFYNKKPPMTGGNLPFLGATEKNNGITGYTDLETVYMWTKTGEETDKTCKNKLFGPNWIAVTNNGSVGHAYFMPYQYTSSHDVTSLYLPDRDLTENLALFLIEMLKRAGRPFSYARKWRPVRLRKTPIYLPIKNDGTPDWMFMEEYIQIELNRIKKKYKSPQKHEINDFRSLDEVGWSEYFIDEIIDVSSGVRLIKGEQIEGKLPFIGASESNNGITAYIENKNSSTESNVLGVNYNGSVGFAFYHPYQATFSDDVKRLKFKKGINNKYTLLFLKHAIERQSKKYAYGYKFNGQRMKRQIIKLPSLSENPDFEFMEQYMKRMENRAIDTLKINIKKELLCMNYNLKNKR